MRRIGLLAMALLATWTLAGVPLVLAAPPRIIRRHLDILETSEGNQNPGALRFEFHEIGVDPNQEVEYQASTTGTPTWLCLSSGVREQRTAGEMLTFSSKPGTPQQPLVRFLGPIGPSLEFRNACRGRVALVEIEYTHTLVCDLTHNVCEDFQHGGIIRHRFSPN
jgi:hypothetical protein